MKLSILSQTIWLTSQLFRSLAFHLLPTTQRLIYTSTRTISTSMVGSSSSKMHIDIPEDRVEVNFCRSSGPGGQNVNKVNTKAELRFKISEADWIPMEVRGRLSDYQSNKISKDGYLVITSQEHRLQARNKVECFEKLREMLREAYIEPKERQMYTEISEKGKNQRKHEKKMRSKVKESRRRVDFD